MSKVKRKELVEKAKDHELRIFKIEKALEQHGINWFMDEPQLKQLDQSIFDGLDEKWRFAAVDSNGHAYVFQVKPELMACEWDVLNSCNLDQVSGIFNASNWQNSLIERDDIAKELTGSELCKAMLERGDKYVMCLVGTNNDVVVIEGMHGNGFVADGMRNLYLNPKPINNQGEPLTASEVGL